jgi:hypothetical protein
VLQSLWMMNLAPSKIVPWELFPNPKDGVTYSISCVMTLLITRNAPHNFTITPVLTTTKFTSFNGAL